MDYDVSNDKNTICKLTVKGEIIYAKLTWTNNQSELFQITLYDGDKMWSGVLSPNYASLVDESIEEYQQNIKIGFVEPSDFVFDLSVASCGKKACFSWLKVFEDQTEMPYGSLEVHMDNKLDAKNSLVEFLFEYNNKLREIITLYERRNKALSNNFEKCKRELEESVNLKNCLETDLYGKFVQVLNEKKRRIQTLEDYIQKHE